MRVSEDFYSIQGEGITQGTPSYFVRLAGCNLMCGGKDGSLMNKGKATWYCDSEDVWRAGKQTSNAALLAKMAARGNIEDIIDGTTHIIWTGGEPTLPKHISDITDYMNYLHRGFPEHTTYTEIETNATRVVPDTFYGEIINQVNASPKLSNSGMPYNRRVNPEAIEQIRDYKNSQFKFVVSNEDDIAEINNNYVRQFKIPKKKVVLMPAVDNLKDLPEMTRFVYEQAIKYGYKATTRGQILAWDKTTGV